MPDIYYWLMAISAGILIAFAASLFWGLRLADKGKTPEERARGWMMAILSFIALLVGVG